MYVVISYDVNTETKEGRRRLRQVAKACESRGQRAQKSVFEVSVTQAQFEALRLKLLGIIDETEDSLRVYHLIEPHHDRIEAYGRRTVIDLDEPLIL